MNTRHYFEDVSLLVTHYNRSKSLERLFVSFERQGCFFREIIVSDDCSNEEHLRFIEKLRANFDFTLVSAKQNGGLGSNMNKGQDAVKTPYTLYVQEDFIALDGSCLHLQNGRKLLEERADFDMVRFYAYVNYPFLKPDKNGFSEMVFKLWSPGLDKFPYYSDHPHLRRSTFTDKFGRYPEGLSGDKTEFIMMMSFLRNSGKAFFFNDYKGVFEQANTAVEPSTMKRGFFRNSSNVFIVFIRTIYRYLNYYFGYLSGRPLWLS
ncbi:glycosyltransferase [Parapedobacter koreensis]|uniref:Glycosyltransferase involved in cell wall bisynthesis n=1 Tax=Parapedobacter koreensis TaxID=332977 RepID=A0A1H7IKH4_9SPHI|nr:glycosyltransferase family 2 protein [Parapedobacter koreensis]SEK62362.1 Glycosyltransferase involved in cell wall bisynthesis [Parapedobacter koreensis]